MRVLNDSLKSRYWEVQDALVRINTDPSIRKKIEMRNKRNNIFLSPNPTSQKIGTE